MLSSFGLMPTFSHGRDPLLPVRQRLGLVSGSEAGRDGTKADGDGAEAGANGDGTKEHEGITMEELRDNWRSVVDDLKEVDKVDIHSPENALEGALCIRYEAIHEQVGKP